MGRIEAKRISEFAQYLAENEKAQNTIDCYTIAVRQYFEMPETGAEVTKSGMIAFKQKVIESYSPKTAANRCIAMNQYCEFIGRPDCKVRTVKTPKRTSVENVITAEEYKRLLDGLEADGNMRIYWMVQFLAKTGARVSEFIQLERRHLGAGKAELWTKGKIRRILIPEALIVESKEYFGSQPDNKWLFPSLATGGQLTARGVAEIIKKSGVKYGIRPEVLHPHSFRHFFAIQFLERNSNITLLSDLLGHESVDTTAIYLQLSEEEQRRQFSNTVNW